MKIKQIARNQKNAERDILIQELLFWAKEQPEYATGIFPDVERTINPVEKLRLSRLADIAKKHCTNPEPVQNFVKALIENNITSTLIALTPLLEALCKQRNILPDKIKSNIDGISWQDVKKWAEEYIKTNPFPGIVKLAKMIPCSRNTMKKAINKSSILSAAEQQYNAHHGTPTAVSLTNKDLATHKVYKEVDPSLVADTDNLLQKLIRETPEPLKSETQAKIEEMSREQKQALAALYAKQNDDELQDDPEKRKPRFRKP